MATNKNFEVKNGLTIAGTERISSAGAFTGSLASATTAATQSATDNSTKIATTAYTDAAITAVIGGAPGTLDTLNELAAAINDDASYASTLTTALATKASIASPATFTGTTLAAITTSSTANDRSGAGFSLTESSTDSSRRATMYLDADNGAFGTGDSGAYFYMEKKGAGGEVNFVNQDSADMNFQTNGSHKRITIKNAGNVGIGMTSPSAKLHVQGATSGANLLIDDGAGYGVYVASQNAFNFNYGRNATSTGYMNFRGYQDGATQFRNLNIGNGKQGTVALFDGVNSRVGIGTTSPQRPLHVNGTEGVLRLTSTASGNNGFEVGVGTSSQAFLWNAENSHIEIATNNTERVRIDSSGKVLIGDSASHVDDLLQIETPASGGGHGIQIRRNDSNGDQGIGRIMFGNNNDTDLATIQANTDGQADSARLAFFTQPTSGTSKERMRIESGGNIRQHYATDPGNNKRFTTPINPQIAQVGLQGYWDPTKANSYSGNTIYDFSPSTHGNGNQDLTKGSGVTHVTNANRAVWQFDGTSNASMQGNPNLAAQKSCSFSFWIYFQNVNSLSGGYQLNGIQIGNHYMYIGIVQGSNNNASLYSYIGQGTNIVHGSSASTQNAYINSDEWVYLTVQAGHGSSDVTGRSHGRAEVYLNGSLVTRASSIPLPTVAASSFYLGRIQGGYYLNGYMGPAVLYERTLHQWEILENMRVHADMYMA